MEINHILAEVILLFVVGLLLPTQAAPHGQKHGLMFVSEYETMRKDTMKWPASDIVVKQSQHQNHLKHNTDLKALAEKLNRLKSKLESVGLVGSSDFRQNVQSDAGRTQGDVEEDIAAVLKQAKRYVDDQASTRYPQLQGAIHSLLDLLGPVMPALMKYKVGKFTCEICKLGVGLIQTLVASQTSSEGIMSAAQEACTILKIESPRVCKGLVQLFAPEVLTVLDMLILSPAEICGLVFGSDCGDPYNPLDNWNVTFPPVPQPPPVHPSPPKEGSPTMRVLHLTDIHFDAQYKAGTNANCGEPLCCRESSGMPTNNSDAAWKFGDYRSCDTPVETLEHMFASLSAQNDTFDYIIWTGDLPAHNVWNQSRSDQLTTMRQVVSLFLKYFPGKPVYPSLGNHESSPVNSYPPPYITGENSITWLYDALADSWKNWLPQDALESVKRGAYYTVSPYAGFRIISLNMNYCNNENWWMLLNTTDPAGELQWLIATLQKAEDSGEKVHILGHIPPGIVDCLMAWSWNYYKIVSRYQNTIAGQFFGHTHMDEFEVFYDVETLQVPVSVAYIGPSVTPYSNFNMGYRFYIVDGVYKNSSFQVLDHETFYMNLTKAHIEGKIAWEFEYSAKKAYNLSNIYPKDWDYLITQMKTNQTLLEQYNRFLTKSRGSGACDASCKKTLLCGARSGRSHDPGLCKDLGIWSMEDLRSLMGPGQKYC